MTEYGFRVTYGVEKNRAEATYKATGPAEATAAVDSINRDSTDARAIVVTREVSEWVPL